MISVVDSTLTSAPVVTPELFTTSTCTVSGLTRTIYVPTCVSSTAGNIAQFFTSLKGGVCQSAVSIFKPHFTIECPTPNILSIDLILDIPMAKFVFLVDSITVERVPRLAELVKDCIRSPSQPDYRHLSLSTSEPVSFTQNDLCDVDHDIFSLIISQLYPDGPGLPGSHDPLPQLIAPFKFTYHRPGTLAYPDNWPRLFQVLRLLGWTELHTSLVQELTKLATYPSYPMCLPAAAVLAKEGEIAAAEQIYSYWKDKALVTAVHGWTWKEAGRRIINEIRPLKRKAGDVTEQGDELLKKIRTDYEERAGPK